MENAQGFSKITKITPEVFKEPVALVEGENGEIEVIEEIAFEILWIEADGFLYEVTPEKGETLDQVASRYRVGGPAVSKITVSSKSIARLAYGYELMFSTLCNIAGTSGGSPQWFTNKGIEAIERVDPLWKLNEDSNAHKPGDCLSQHVPFAEWAADAEKKASALNNWRDEVGKLHSQIARKDAQIVVLTERLRAIIDWCDFAMKNADEFDSHGVRNLDGPVLDAARNVLAAAE